MRSFPAAIVLSCLSVTAAFQVASMSLHQRYYHGVKPLYTAKELTPIEEMCLENVAEFCLHESCDIEEYEGNIAHSSVQ